MFKPRVLKKLRDIQRQLDEILLLLLENAQRGEQMSQELQDLEAQVGQTTDVAQSAVVLLDGLKSALDAAIAANDPAALKALSVSLGSSKDRLAAAVARNTPAAPPAPAAP